jgi:hypothetical protein
MYFPMFSPLFFLFSEVFKVPKASVGTEILVSSRVESLAESGRIDLTMVKIATGTMGR